MSRECTARLCYSPSLGDVLEACLQFQISVQSGLCGSTGLQSWTPFFIILDVNTQDFGCSDLACNTKVAAFEKNVPRFVAHETDVRDFNYLLTGKLGAMPRCFE